MIDSVIFHYVGSQVHHCIFPRTKFQSCSSFNNSVMVLLLLFRTALMEGVTIHQ